MGSVRVPKVLYFAYEIQDLSGGKGREWAGPTVPRPSPEAAWTHSHVVGAGGPAVRGLALLLAASVALRPSLRAFCISTC